MARRRSFTGQIIILQLLTMLGVAALLSASCSWLIWQQHLAAADAQTLAIARTVASDPQVREAVAASNAGGRDMTDARVASIAAVADQIRARTGALFVVVADADGYRLSHPNPDEIGRQVSTDMSQVLAGQEVVTEETGTLGDSSRAKVPVWNDDGGQVIGEVSVGLSRTSIWSGLPTVLWPVLLATSGTVALAVVASVIIWRRLRRLTLGARPEDFVAFAQNQEAVLGSVDEGVIGVDMSGRVTVANDAAARLIGDGALIGRLFAEIAAPDALHAAVRATLDDRRGRALEAVVADRVVLADARPVDRDGRRVGCVIVLRDKTDVLQLTDRLQAVDAMSQALRAQRHEFANRLHAVHGLLEVGQTDEARGYLARLLERGPLRFPVRHLDRITDPYLQAFVGAKGAQASEAGVALTVGTETALGGRLRDAETVATVLGNLIDNGVRAAAQRGDDPWVEIEIMNDGDECVLVVADSGFGMDDDLDPFTTHTQQLRTTDPMCAQVGAGGSGSAGAPAAAALLENAHGRGIGLPLSRDIARRLGGDVWVATRRAPGAGAVFCARLPGLVDAAAAAQGAVVGTPRLTERGDAAAASEGEERS
ncbi:sensor histidine kinase [Pseudoclavibacter soli]|uniref:sensor histidine kinase n=1 Tax=Pseudoclavibacter soli TaxID=452623 RepID=UPI00042401A1|nr:sensor histidine kinase [Pseudoclavibacter soli]